MSCQHQPKEFILWYFEFQILSNFYFVANKGMDPVQFIKPSSADTFMFFLITFSILFIVFIFFFKLI